MIKIIEPKDIGAKWLTKKNQLFFPFLMGSIISIWLCFIVAERFFFDRLFYQKASFYGYNYDRNANFEIINQKNPLAKYFLNNRIRDLKKLMDLSLDRTSIIEPKNLAVNVLITKKFTKSQPLKIAVIGDSNTYGMGISQNQRYSNVLEKFLNKTVPTKVFNLSEPGNSLEDDYALYLLAKERLQPDFVIIGILENDLIFNQSKYPNSESVRSMLQNFCPQDIFSASNIELINSDWNEVIDIYQESFLPTYANSCFLKKLASDFAEDKTLIFFNFFNHQQMFCSIDDSLANSKHRAIMTAYRTELINSGNTVIGHDPNQTVFSTVSKAETHPSASANKDFAKIIYDHISKKLNLPQN